MPVFTAPLSLAQERLWFLEQFSPNTATYNVPLTLDIDGPLDRGVLERALGEIVRRHEPLRTLFMNDEGRPQQAVQPYETFCLPVEDVRDDVDRRIAEEIGRPFDLERGPIFRARLLRLDDTHHVLAMVVHHIVFDGWSLGIFFRELSALYTAFASGHPSPLPPLPTRYVNFAVAQREHLTGELASRQIAYWREHLQPPLPVLTLPSDRPRPPVQTSHGQRASMSVPETQIARLQEVARANGVTLFMTLVALYAVLLHRLGGQTDIVIGTPIANRTRRETERLIGFFVNSLALRIAISPDMTIRQVFATVKQVALNAYANQDVPFARVVEVLNPARDPSRSPIFQTLLSFDNTPLAMGDDVVSGPVTFRRRHVSTGTAKVDLTLLIRPGADGRRVFLETNADLFDAATGTRMLQEFCDLVAAAPDHVDVRIDQLSGQSTGQLTGRLPAAPGPIGEAAPYPRDATVASLFELQAARTPEAPAVSDGTVAWTYRELNERANRLAHVLSRRRRDVAGNEASSLFTVGVCLERSADAVVALLAILKAGGAYVPLDPSFPPARLNELASRAKLQLIVTNEAAVGRVSETGATLVAIDREAAAIAGAPSTDPATAIAADALAYILFTSGTTGAPKAVGVPHRAIVRLVYGLPAIALGDGQTVLHAAPLSFDAATFEIWGPLLHGGCVAIAAPLMLGASDLTRLIAAHRITVMWLTASLFNAIVDERVETLAPVRYVITGGETLSVPHVARAMSALPGTRFFNGYGPTEATTFTTCHEIGPSDSAIPSGIPIGRPLLNTRVYVMDQAGRPVEPGEAGEIWIGGDGLALGYFGDPESTAARFVPDPFAEHSGARLFRSGDRGRVLHDGITLEFLGRLDDQIKIRGFRIEPGEVEAAIGLHPGVSQCAVVAVDLRSLGRTLVAFYVPASDAGDGASPQHIREFLRSRLPEYMIPGRWTTVEALPLLDTGKIDRQALKARAATDDVAGAGPTAIVRADGISDVVTSIWREVLGVGDLGPDDHFFDCGGHSLLAVQMLSKVRAALDVEVGVRALFEAPTLGGFVQIVARMSSGPAGTSASRNAKAPASVSAGGAPRADGLLGSERGSSLPTGTRSRENVAAGLLDIWRELFGRSDIGSTDNFFDIGGHSLLATRLAAGIEQRFGIDLPLRALFTHGTIDAQTSLIAEVVPADDWSPIVPIQPLDPSSAEPPLFIVHGIGGEVISFQAVGRHLGRDIPIYGVEADHRPTADDDWTLERLASTYAAAITNVYPDGPYRLSGFSAGGLIAFEIAQQLRRAGRHVSSLVMLDAPAKMSQTRSLSAVALARLIRNGAYWLVDDDFLRSGWAMQRKRVQQRLRRLWAGSAPALESRPGAPDIRDQLGLWEMPASMNPYLERLGRMLRSYQPEPYAGSITVITARTHSLFNVMGPDLGWTPFARGGVTTRIVPGSHDTILREPRVRELAAVLREFLRADR